jgi:O-antigen biosynthesis protein
MKDSSSPFVSIITVNFNGIFFLKTLFDSIASLNYPKENLQVIMVDNGSTDGSVSYVESNYRFVEILKINKNLGFAGGNNEGAKAARGDYIAFINNDCAVEKDWLATLVKTIREKEAQNIKAGGAGSKVLFYFKYLSLKLSFDCFNHSNSDNKNGDGFKALIKELRLKPDNQEFLQMDMDGCGSHKNNLLGFANKSFKYSSGIYSFGRDEDKNIVRRVKNNAVVRVPIADMERDIELEFMISFLEPKMNFKIFLEDGNSDDASAIPLFEFNEKSIEERKDAAGGNLNNDKCQTKPHDEKNFIKAVFKIPSEKYRNCQSIVNSCGSMINKAFYAKEINYECIDSESDGQPFEVFALPGSSFIINKKLVEEIGLFDEKFFTYYEDIDFFWRAALKGWRFFAVPKSIARHFHCGSGEEWSNSFTYHVLRNRLLMIYRCCWLSGFLKNYLSFCAAAAISLLYLAAAKVRQRKLNRPDILIRIKIFFEFFILMPMHLGKRIKIRSGSSKYDKNIKKWQQDF